MIFTEAAAASLRRISSTVVATVDIIFFFKFLGAVKTIVFGVLCSSLKKILGEEDDEQQELTIRLMSRVFTVHTLQSRVSVICSSLFCF